MVRKPVVELDEPYSDETAEPTTWTKARGKLRDAGVYWLSTVRPDGRPHVTPVAGVVMDDAVYFSTGPSERKAKNLAQNKHVVVTTGSNAFRKGLDVVVEGDAKPVHDEATLQRLADTFARKYDDHFGFRVADGAFAHEAGTAEVYEVAPIKAFGYGRTKGFSATRYRF